MGKPEDEERVIMEEDCGEDKLGAGYLRLTNRRLLFQKGETRMLTFSKKMTELALNLPLEKIAGVRTEGLLAKKVVVEVSEPKGVVYKFGVFSTGKWRKVISEAVQALPSSSK